MSMSDPIADMLTRIRNGQQVQKATVLIPASKVKRGIAQVLLFFALVFCGVADVGCDRVGLLISRLARDAQDSVFCLFF